MADCRFRDDVRPEDCHTVKALVERTGYFRADEIDIAVELVAERLARGGQAEVERLDEAIAAASTNWRFERIAAVDRNILRIAAYELMKEPQTPSKVIIDEAVEMAKRFGEADSPPFVNGVLDAVMRKVRGPEDGGR